MRCPSLAELPPPPQGRSGWPWTEETPPEAAPGSGPRISIVTPSFNQARFLEETIRSVLLQGWSDLQYVVMDGGSTDGSVEILRRYERWLAHWQSGPDGGQSAAINAGLRRSDGALWAWVNSDDAYRPGAFRAVAEHFADHGDVGMVYGDCDVIDEDGVRFDRCPTHPYRLEPLVRNQFFIPQPATFLRREVAAGLDGVREDLHLVMDWDLWLRVALDGRRIDYLPRTLAAFRVWPDAKTSAQAERSAAEKLRVLDRVFSDEGTATRIAAYRHPAYSDVHYFASVACRDNDHGLRGLGHLVSAVAHRPVDLFHARPWRHLRSHTRIIAAGTFHFLSKFF